MKRENARRKKTTKPTIVQLATASRSHKASKRRGQFWRLRLYVAGQTPNSIQAISNLKRLCEDRLKDQYKVEIIDLLDKPQLAKGDQIVAIPTLVRRLPSPMKKIIGNLSDADRVFVGLDLRPVA